MPAANQTLIEDVLSLGGKLLGQALEARHELKAQAKQRVEDVARQMDLVTRDEFDAAFAMLAKARAMQEALNDRLTSIEAKLGMSSATKSRKSMKVNLPSVKKSKQRTRRK